MYVVYALITLGYGVSCAIKACISHQILNACRNNRRYWKMPLFPGVLQMP